MAEAIFTRAEVDLARSIFGIWLKQAKKQADPQAFLVERFTASGLTGATSEQGEFGIYRWTSHRGVIYALGEDFRTVLWRRTVGYMARAALTNLVQLSFLE